VAELQKNVVQSRLEECLGKNKPDHSCKFITVVSGSCNPKPKVETLLECSTLASTVDRAAAAKCLTVAITPEVFQDRPVKSTADGTSSTKRSGSSSSAQFVVTSESTDDSSLSTGAIIGIVIGAICGAILIVAIIVLAFFLTKGDGRENV
jgi:hypothetical protein